MKSRMILPALLAVGLFCLASASSAQAGLFGHAGCGCEPACGCETTCEVACDPCCAPRMGLLARLRAKCAAKRCCEPVCGCEAPCEPTCGCEAPCEPACGCEPACDPCCAPRMGLLARLRAKCAAKRCCEPVCGCEAPCEPACGYEVPCEPACGCEPVCDPCCAPRTGSAGPPASQVRCQACVLRAGLRLRADLRCASPAAAATELIHGPLSHTTGSDRYAKYAHSPCLATDRGCAISCP